MNRGGSQYSHEEPADEYDNADDQYQEGQSEYGHDENQGYESGQDNEEHFDDEPEQELDEHDEAAHDEGEDDEHDEQRGIEKRGKSASPHRPADNEKASPPRHGLAQYEHAHLDPTHTTVMRGLHDLVHSPIQKHQLAAMFHSAMYGLAHLAHHLDITDPFLDEKQQQEKAFRNGQSGAHVARGDQGESKRPDSRAASGKSGAGRGKRNGGQA